MGGVAENGRGRRETVGVPLQFRGRVLLPFENASQRESLWWGQQRLLLNDELVGGFESLIRSSSSSSSSSRKRRKRRSLLPRLTTEEPSASGLVRDRLADLVEVDLDRLAVFLRTQFKLAAARDRPSASCSHRESGVRKTAFDLPRPGVEKKNCLGYVRPTLTLGVSLRPTEGLRPDGGERRVARVHRRRLDDL
jgi:hypothetical protein